MSSKLRTPSDTPAVPWSDNTVPWAPLDVMPPARLVRLTERCYQELQRTDLDPDRFSPQAWAAFDYWNRLFYQCTAALQDRIER